jgi:hypothetical protein
MTSHAKVARIPSCNFCSEDGLTVPAQYDFKTKQGPWAYGCADCWEEYRAYPHLGMGKGQKLVLRK